MRRRSLKGQLSIRLQQCSDSASWTDTELLLSAVNSLIHSTEQLHHKLHPPLTSSEIQFREVMIDTLERATQFLRDRAEDGVTDEEDDALLRECETVLVWATSQSDANAQLKSIAAQLSERDDYR